jgi:hypothetical protein
MFVILLVLLNNTAGAEQVVYPYREGYLVCSAAFAPMLIEVLYDK